MSFTNKDLRKVGLKVTLPRIKILELLENAEHHHMSAETSIKPLPIKAKMLGLPPSIVF